MKITIPDKIIIDKVVLCITIGHHLNMLQMMIMIVMIVDKILIRAIIREVVSTIRCETNKCQMIVRDHQ